MNPTHTTEHDANRKSHMPCGKESSLDRMYRSLSGFTVRSARARLSSAHVGWVSHTQLQQCITSYLTKHDAPPNKKSLGYQPLVAELARHVGALGRRLAVGFKSEASRVSTVLAGRNARGERRSAVVARVLKTAVLVRLRCERGKGKGLGVV